MDNTEDTEDTVGLLLFLRGDSVSVSPSSSKGKSLLGPSTSSVSPSSSKGKSLLGPSSKGKSILKTTLISQGTSRYGVKDTLLAMRQIQERFSPSSTCRVPSLYEEALKFYLVDRIETLGNNYDPAVAARREYGEAMFEKAQTIADFRNADLGSMAYRKRFSVAGIRHTAASILDEKKARQLTVDVENAAGIIHDETGFLLPNIRAQVPVPVSSIKSELFLRQNRILAERNLADSRTKRMELGNWETHDEDYYNDPPCKLEREIYRYENPLVRTSYSCSYTEIPSGLGSISCRLVSQQVFLPQMVPTHINGPSCVAGIFFISALYFLSLKNLNFEFARVDNFSSFIEF